MEKNYVNGEKPDYVNHAYIKAFRAEHGHSPWLICGAEAACLLEPTTHPRMKANPSVNYPKCQEEGHFYSNACDVEPQCEQLEEFGMSDVADLDQFWGFPLRELVLMKCPCCNTDLEDHSMTEAFRCAQEVAKAEGRVSPDA